MSLIGSKLYHKGKKRQSFFSLGRIAILFKQRKSRDYIVNYCLKRYGASWRIESHSEIERFLFEKRRGKRTVSSLFENKSEEEIRRNLRKRLELMQAQAERGERLLAELNNDSEFKKASADGASRHMKKLWENKEFAEKVRKRNRRLCKSKKLRKMASAHMRRLNKKLWKDPEFAKAVKKRFAQNHTSEAGKRVSRQLQELRQDPTFDELWLEKARAGWEKFWASPSRSKAERIKRQKRLEQLWKNPAWRAQEIEFLKKPRDLAKNSHRIYLKTRGLEPTYNHKTERWTLAMTNNPADTIIAKEQTAKIGEAMLSLPDDLRELVEHSVFGGKNSSQIGRMLNLEKVIVERALKEAFAKLAVHLQDFSNQEKIIA